MDYDIETQVEDMFIAALGTNTDIADAHYDIIHWNDVSGKHPEAHIEVHCPVTISRDRPAYAGGVDKALVIIAVFMPRASDPTGATVNKVRGWCRATLKRKDLIKLLNANATDCQVNGGPNSIQMVGSENVNTDPDRFQRNITMELPVGLDLT